MDRRKREIFKRMMSEFFRNSGRNNMPNEFMGFMEPPKAGNSMENMFGKEQQEREPDKVETQQENGIIYEKKIWYNENGGATIQTSMYTEGGEEMGSPMRMEMGRISADDLFEQLMGGNPSEMDESQMSEEEILRRMMGEEPKPKTLQEQLDDAITNEDYELAAKIRDKMKESEGKD